MVESVRNPLIGLLCLSMVGCANMSDEDMAAAGMVVVGIGALVALALLNDGKEDERNRNGKDKHKDAAKHEHRKGHPGRH